MNRKCHFFNFSGFFLCLVIAGQPAGFAQQKAEIDGYLKSLQSFVFLKVPPLPRAIMLNDQLLHSRLNFRYFPSENFSLVAGLRSRTFIGDQVLLDPDFVNHLNDAADDFLRLSTGYRNVRGYALHTGLDRLYAEWQRENWRLRLGRQRINWGIATLWNPNDLFNAYNFTDFDYEERPGTDALYAVYYSGFASSVELAVKAADSLEALSAGLLFKLHTGSYDWQVLAGAAERYAVLGGGWAGNLGNASFKGELAWFYAFADEHQSSLTATLGLDYTFQNELYINGGVFYNSLGTTAAAGYEELFAEELSARHLYPYKYAVLAQALYPFTPLLNGGLVAVYSPGEAHALFLNPILGYSLAQNWDLDFVLQFFLQKEGSYQSPAQAAYLRLKWSF